MAIDVDMENAKPAEPPKKKTAKVLQAEIKVLTDALDKLRQQLDQAHAELKGYRTGSAQHEQVVKDLSDRLAKAKIVLAPFKKKTKSWEQWPPLQARMAREVTWGDLKAAADVEL